MSKPTSGAQLESARAQEIIAAARQLLEAEGADALSMRRIADRLGIKAPSIYKHLRDKQSVANALISDGFVEIADAFKQTLADTTEPPLAALAHTYRRYALDHPHLYRLMTEQPLDRPNLAPGVEAEAARPLVEVLDGDADLARAAFAFVHGMTILELNDRFPPGADVDAAWECGVAALTTAARMGGAEGI